MKETKNSIGFVIQLNKDDWMCEKSVTTHDQCKSFKFFAYFHATVIIVDM